jgi:hypothetical protein
MYIWDCRSHPIPPAAPPEPVGREEEVRASAAPTRLAPTAPDSIAERRAERKAESPALAGADLVEA